MRVNRSHLLLLVLAGALTGCLTPLDPGSADVREVRVLLGERSLAEDTMAVRSTRRAHAIALAADGYDLGVTRFRFASSDDRVATVDSLGTVRAVSPGEATITASVSGGASGSAKVVVVASTIAYTIPMGGSAGAIAFSPDYTKAYVVVNGTSLAIVDALGFYRVQTISLDASVGDVATTATSVFVTHPEADAVTVIDAGTKTVRARLSVGRGPTGVATLSAGAGEVLVTLRGDRKVAALSEHGVERTLALDGAPSLVRTSRDGRRAFVAVEGDAGGRWLEMIDLATFTVTGRLALPAAPTDIAAVGDGNRVYVLAAGMLYEINVGDAGSLSVGSSVSAPSQSAGIDVRDGESALVIVSGVPLTVYDGASLAASDRIESAGVGRVAVRPDGLFAFIADAAKGVLQVIGL